MDHNIAVNALWYMAVFVLTFGVSFIVFMWGYHQGYKAAMKYSSAKLDEYHEHTMKNIRELGELARKR